MCKKSVVAALILLSGCVTTQQPKGDLREVVSKIRLQYKAGYKTLLIVEKAKKLDPKQQYYYIGKHVYEMVDKAAKE